MSAVTSFSIICNVTSNTQQFLEMLLNLHFSRNENVQLILVSTVEHEINQELLISHFIDVQYMCLPSTYSEELQIDRAIAVSTGLYIVFLRQHLSLKKSFLHYCIQYLKTTNKSIGSTDSDLVVVSEREYLINNGMASAITDKKLHEPIEPPSPTEIKNKGVFKDLFNRNVTLEYGVGSFVDPEVVVDSPERIHIGSNTVIRKGVILRPETGEIYIGDDCVIEHYCVFHAKGGIYIGDWSIISPHCAFYAQNLSFERFDIPIIKQCNSGKGIYLMGDNWVGSHTVICDNVTLGKGSVIGANSTVTRSIPLATVAVGSPARVIKNRFAEDWNFQQRERASEHGMPEDIVRYVQGRGELLKRFVNSDDSVLDVGCEEGIITAKIAEKVKDTIGCDYCSTSIAEAGKKHPHIIFMTANVTQLPFENERFSRVVFSEVAEHLMLVQLKQTLREIVRVLQVDGVLLLTTPVTGAGKKTSTYSHIYEYSQQQVTTLLSEYFSNVQFIHSGFGLFLASNKKVY